MLSWDERRAQFCHFSTRRRHLSPTARNIDYKILALDVYEEAAVNIIRTRCLDIICRADHILYLLLWQLKPQMQTPTIRPENLYDVTRGGKFRRHRQRKKISLKIMLLEIQHFGESCKHQLPLLVWVSASVRFAKCEKSLPRMALCSESLNAGCGIGRNFPFTHRMTGGVRRLLIVSEPRGTWKASAAW
jgi:hypothetical protein